MRFAWVKGFSLLLILWMMVSCLKDELPKIELNYQPEHLNDGWQVVEPEEVGMDKGKIQAVYQLFFDQDQYSLGVGLLVVKNGKLVAEGYTRDLNDRDSIFNIKSATKSVTSMLTGIAIHNGLIDSAGQTLQNFFPEYVANNSRKKAITLHQLLTMTSGLKWSNTIDTWPLMTSTKDNSVEYVISRELEFDPGSDFHYTDGQPQVVAGILQKLAGESLASYAERMLFDPLGIKRYHWERHKDGVTYGAVALYLTARDFAKLGQLALRKGQWEGQTIFSRQWMETSTTSYTESENGIKYGYYWWVRPEMNAFTAIGHGGQYLYVIPDLDLLVVGTAFPYALQYDGFDSLERFERLVEGIVNAVE